MALAIGASNAQDLVGPRLISHRPDWEAARIALASEHAERKDVSFDSMNTALAERFPGIASSAVPVLLPLNTTALMQDVADGQTKLAEAYLGGFTRSGFFLAGPTGYDAVFTVRAGSAEFNDVSFAEPILVEVSGFALTYDLPPPKSVIETSPRELEKDFPGIRRVMAESHLRYSFMRYGVRYVVSIQCYDAAPRARRLACKQADKIAPKMLRALRLAGGNPDSVFKPFEPKPIARPEQQSPDFTYYPPGKLIPNTGMKGNDGVPDYTVYAQIRYPIGEAPSFANSQSFMHWGDCDQTGRTGRTGSKDGNYRCRVNSKPLIFNEGAKENYDYPWRDNFCEHRFYFVGQCAAGIGHQGQDIRPGKCPLKNEGADRCQPYGDDVVAVHDGMILRQRKQEGWYLVANDENARIRFRYIHMNPNRLDDDNVLSGRRVKAGEVVGKIANFNRKENGTTLHLHFEAMVPTDDGWMRVNPYATLIAGYERLIGGRGREFQDEPAPVVAVTEVKQPVIATSPEPEKSAKRGKRVRLAKASHTRAKASHSLSAAQRHGSKGKRARRR